MKGEFSRNRRGEALQVGPRYSRPTGHAGEDVLIFHVGPREYGPSFLAERADAEALHEWLGRWLADGWDGIPRRCGRYHRDPGQGLWQCDQDPGHTGDCQGPAVTWTAAGGRPERRSWPKGGGDEHR